MDTVGRKRYNPDAPYLGPHSPLSLSSLVVDDPSDDPLHLCPLLLSQILVLIGSRSRLFTGVDKGLALAGGRE
jgi:hypothetical protein